MQSKRWAIWCAFVGIIGGAFLMVAPLVLLAAGSWRGGPGLTMIGFLAGLANTFVISGAIGCTPIFILIVGCIPFLNDLLYWLFSAIFSEQNALSLVFLAVVFAALLSIVSGIGYAVCLKNFRE